MFGSLTSPIGMNQWLYAGANPLTMHDPTGMRTEQCTGTTAIEIDSGACPGRP